MPWILSTIAFMSGKSTLSTTGEMVPSALAWWYIEVLPPPMEKGLETLVRGCQARGSTSGLRPCE